LFLSAAADGSGGAAEGDLASVLAPEPDRVAVAQDLFVRLSPVDEAAARAAVVAKNVVRPVEENLRVMARYEVVRDLQVVVAMASELEGRSGDGKTSHSDVGIEDIEASDGLLAFGAHSRTSGEGVQNFLVVRSRVLHKRHTLCTAFRLRSYRVDFRETPRTR